MTETEPQQEPPETIPATGQVRGHVLPDDALERLERLVGVLSEPLVIFTAELAAERDAALWRARNAEAQTNRLVKAMQSMVDNYPATSWGQSNLALDDAKAALREISEEGATMGQTTTPQDGAHPDAPEDAHPARR